MGVGENFRIFCDNLIVPNQSDISYRYRRITRRLNLDFWGVDSETSHSFYVGSYGRNTAIGASDLDVLFQLPYSVYERFNGYAGNGQSALLQAIRTSIQNTYSVTSVGGDGQVVVVPFTDGVKFEILPAFINKDDSYTYPDSNGGGTWKKTDPKPEIQAIKARDALYGGNLRRLCRMMRAWKHEWQVPIKSLLIDTLAYRFIETWEHREKSYVYYDWMVRDFFLYLSNQNDTQTYWSAPGSGDPVWSIGSFQYKAKRCYNISLEAIKYDSDNMSYTARGKWREIFGSKYSSP
ncbi:SMODS domain-containing nucleotidyltransferase [Deinococcus phoenicis]|uniref:SMODS domain-containing nucleotidyltransferase n=1 Tax=Deinococcus phoenicis TaxID=1476583 RepID=UPI0009DCBCBE|nr:nucleotidyltransferase [Deinococcus phoenicis]